MKLLTALFLIVATSLFGAVPSYTVFRGTGGILITSNPPTGNITIDGSGIFTSAGTNATVAISTNGVLVMVAATNVNFITGSNVFLAATNIGSTAHIGFNAFTPVPFINGAVSNYLLTYILPVLVVSNLSVTNLSAAPPWSSIQFNSNGITRGSSKLVFTNDNVGIGTDQPTDRLMVVSTTNSSTYPNIGIGVQADPTNGYAYYALYNPQAGAQNFALYNGYPTKTNFTIRQSGVRNLLVGEAGTGFIGIGTADPMAQLHVVYEANTVGGIVPRGIVSQANDDTDHSAHITARKSHGTVASPTGLGSNSYVGAFTAEGYDGTNYERSGFLVWVVTGSNNNALSTKFALATSSAGAETEWLTLTSDGKFGMATTAPTNTLDVNGSVDIRNDLFLPALPTNGSPIALLSVDAGGKVFETALASGGSSVAPPISSVQFNSNGVQQGSANLTFTNGQLYVNNPGAVGSAQLRLDNTTQSASWDLVIDSNPETYILGVRNGATYSMVWEPAGNVGIGTTNPTTRLDVQGRTTLRSNVFLPNIASNASPIAFLATDAAGEVFETAVPTGGSGGTGTLTSTNQQPVLVVVDGDSNSTTDYAGVGFSWGEYLKKKQPWTNFVFTNIAQSFRPASNAVVNFDVRAGSMGILSNSTYHSAVYIGWLGLVDVFFAYPTNEIIASISNNWRLARQAGYSVIGMTIPQSGAAYATNTPRTFITTNRWAVNNWIRTHARTNQLYDALVDTEVLLTNGGPRFLDVEGDWYWDIINTNYEASVNDGVHFGPLAQSIIADHIASNVTRWATQPLGIHGGTIRGPAGLTLQDLTGTGHMIAATPAGLLFRTNDTAGGGTTVTNAALTNLVGTSGNNVTNVVSLSTTNATSNPLTNSYTGGTLTLFGLEAGANVTVTPNGSNLVIAATAGGGGGAGSFAVNPNQFVTNSLLNFKSGALTTNLIVTHAPGTTGQAILTAGTNTSGNGLNVSSNGFVGIGTASPTAPVSIHGPPGELLKLANTASGLGYVGFYTLGDATSFAGYLGYADANQLYLVNERPGVLRLVSASGRNIEIAAGGLVRMLVDSTGLVGIGTSAPPARLTAIADNSVLNVIQFGTTNKPSLLLMDTNGNTTIGYQGGRLVLTNADIAIGKVWTATNVLGGGTWSNAPAGGASGFAAGNSNQIPFINQLETGYQYAGYLSSTNPGFGFSPSGNVGGGYGGLMVFGNSPMGLVTIGHPNAGSDFATFATALVVSNRYNSAADYKNDMVKIDAVMVGGGLQADSTMTRWRVWNGDTPNDVAELTIKGQMNLANGTKYWSNSAVAFPTAAELGVGGYWVGVSNGPPATLVAKYSLDGTTVQTKVLAP